MSGDNENLTTPPESPSPKPDDKAAAANKRKNLSIIIRDKAVLFAAYMPFLKAGGIFIPTKKTFTMGEVCSLVITLISEDEKFNVTGRVVWITPANVSGGKAGGIGVEFNEDTTSDRLRRRIEEILGPLLRSTNSTHTM